MFLLEQHISNNHKKVKEFEDLIPWNKTATQFKPRYINLNLHPQFNEK